MLAPSVTTPAISSYAAGAGRPSRLLSARGRAPGSGPSNPIALDATGKLSLTIWRPQRLAVPGAETGEFIDMGHLHYGLSGTTPNGGREVACAGHYSGLSSTLSQSRPAARTSGSRSSRSRQRRDSRRV